MGVCWRAATGPEPEYDPRRQAGARGGARLGEAAARLLTREQVGGAAPERAVETQVLTNSQGNLYWVTQIGSMDPVAGAARDGKPLELEVFQGEDDEVLENEYLGSLHFPPAAAGQRGLRFVESL